MTSQTRAVLLKSDLRGENLSLLTWLTDSNGLCRTLLRLPSAKPKKSTRLLKPDLFDSGVIETTEQSGKPAYLQDFQLETRRGGIARSYASLQAAAAISHLLCDNLADMLEAESYFPVAIQAFDALDSGAEGHVVVFKLLFQLARREGYAVREGWLAELPAVEQANTLLLIQKPSLELTSIDALSALEALATWLKGHSALSLNALGKRS